MLKTCAPQEVTPTPVVVAALESLRTEIRDTSAIVQLLWKKLDRVIRQEPCANAPQDQTQPASGVILADDILAERDVVIAVQRSLRALLSVIEA